MKLINSIFLSIIILLYCLPNFVIGHGGIDDGDGEGSKEAPSVYIDDDKSHGALASGNVGLGFGLTVMAALSSALGSLIPFLDLVFPLIPFLKDFSITDSKGFLAGSLSFSSGVLLFLTLGDLFPEAVENFASSSFINKKYASLVSVVIFIGTVLTIMLFKSFIIYIRKKRKIICLCDPKATVCQCDVLKHGNLAIDGLCACFEKGLANQNIKIDDDNDSHDATINNNNSTDIQIIDDNDIDEKKDQTCVKHIVSVKDESELIKPKEAKQLKNLGIQIAISLAVHNFPEGLATFAATIASARIGILFGIALAFHKVPEGFMIALPIYYSTKSAWKAFIIASSVGIASQISGALLGYLLFVTYWNTAVSGFLFAVVTGTLLYTIFHSMMPLARRYDSKDRYCTYWFFGGLFFFSLIASLFSIGA